jgi:outer membrane lipoprotein SlyB
LPNLIIIAAFGAFIGSLFPMQTAAQTAMSVQYGRILEIGTEQLDNSKGKTGGTVVGGLAGAYTGKGKSNSNKALRILGGAAVGGAVGGKAASGEINSYIVNLLNGQTVKVAIDRGNFAIGDCVAVEANSKSANLRRVSEQFCIAEVPQEYKEEHKREANECDAAKQAVVNATTEDEIKTAGMKMDILCQE